MIKSSRTVLARMAKIIITAEYLQVQIVQQMGITTRLAIFLCKQCFNEIWLTHH